MTRSLAPLLLAAFLASPVAAAPPVASPASQAAPIPLDAFLAQDEVVDLLVSPDGEHYAVTVPLEDRTVLVVLRQADLKRTAQVTFPAEVHVTRVNWVNDRQLVYSDARRFGKLAAPRASRRLYRVNVDGSDMAPVSKDYAELTHVLPEDDRVVQVIHYTKGGYPRLARMDVNTGKIEGESQGLPNDSGLFVIDNTGKLRLASSRYGIDLRPTQYLLEANGDWTEINSGEDTGFPWYFVGFSGDNRLAYFIKEEAEGPDGLYAYDLAKREHRLVARHARVDVGRLLRSPLDGGLIAVEYFDGKPQLELIAPEDRFAKELLKVRRAFPGAYVTPTSYTRDGGVGIYSVSSDVHPGEFYRVDHATGQAVPIALRNLHLDPRTMAPTRPFRFKARDGLALEGFVTLPPAADEGPVPLVVMPHGGPIGIFDTWSFDSEIQLLASRGYAVLRVNFRGSGNYGRAFQEAAEGEWGARMQDDVTDATRWAIAEGIARPGRICLYGASYGAYAAMMGLIREPELYACGIGNVGLYDLSLEYRSAQYSRSGREFFGKVVDGKEFAERSPARLARGIQDPVLLGAGVLDRVTPIDQTRAMQRGLKAARVPHEVVLYDDEGHGYYRLENRRDWAQRVLAFLATHLGTAPAPAAASE
jgi:dipeptidyl aminopeptidase/acylaminoacyl peptidase